MPTIAANDTSVASIAPVRRSIHGRASQARAFKVFTEGFDTWWPRSHHIGSSPMTKAIVECRLGGRCYSEQADGTGRLQQYNLICHNLACIPANSKSGHRRGDRFC